MVIDSFMLLLCHALRSPSTTCRQYGKQYVPLEDAARQAKRGIWNGSFEVPQQWRMDNPRGGSGKAAPGSATAAAAAAAAAAVPAPPPAPAPKPAATVASVAGSGGAAAAAPPGCAIKGNISAKGLKIYHVPGAWVGRVAMCLPLPLPGSCFDSTAVTTYRAGDAMLAHTPPPPLPHLPRPGGAYYDSTVIEPEKGERYFCSEAEAQAAGWRAARS